jgi:hypothetical protein
MRVPVAIRVGGRWIRIKYCDESIDEDNIGEYNRDSISPEITINISCPVSHWPMVLTHELRHAAWHTAGLTNILDHDTEEAINDALDNLLLDILQLNALSKNIRWGSIDV